jgi:hypothetical protein
MSKKQYFLIVDTETTQNDLVADFGAVIVDRKGKIITQCAVMVDGIFTDSENNPLFFDSRADGSALWSRSSADKRYRAYTQMVANGSRMIASVAAINRWLVRANTEYSPILTAYNLSFDLGKCENTGIDLRQFEQSFCLWAAAFSAYAHTRGFRQLVLDIHAFNSPTSQGNMSFKTNAETMTRYVLNNPNLADEPHTSLEDAIDYELPILTKLLRSYTTRWLLEDSQAYDWRKVQVKDWFRPA